MIKNNNKEEAFAQCRFLNNILSTTKCFHSHTDISFTEIVLKILFVGGVFKTKQTTTEKKNLQQKQTKRDIDTKRSTSKLCSQINNNCSEIEVLVRCVLVLKQSIVSAKMTKASIRPIICAIAGFRYKKNKQLLKAPESKELSELETSNSNDFN